MANKSWEGHSRGWGSPHASIGHKHGDKAMVLDT